MAVVTQLASRAREGGGAVTGDDDARRLERVRHVTANYRCMQGLRLVPFGLYMVFWSLTKTVWWPEQVFLAPPLPELVGVGVASLASWWIGKYYTRTYGHVQSLPRTVPWIAGYAAACSLVVAGLVADAYGALPVSAFALAFAALLVAYWHVNGRFQTHYLWLAGVLAVAALAAVPLHELARPFIVRRLAGMTAYMVMIGVVYTAAGVLDHLNLTRMLGGNRDED